MKTRWKHDEYVNVPSRLASIARGWHVRFRLPEDQYNDLYQSAWELWLSYTDIKDPKHRVNEVWKRLYYVIIREKYGRIPKQRGGESLPPMPSFTSIDFHEVPYNTDYDNRVLLREISDAVNRKAGNNNKRPQALRQIIDGKATAKQVDRMRRYLRKRDLAA